MVPRCPLAWASTIRSTAVSPVPIRAIGSSGGQIAQGACRPGVGDKAAA